MLLQDKDAKVVYLTKIINLVALFLVEDVTARPLKVSQSAKRLRGDVA